MCSIAPKEYAQERRESADKALAQAEDQFEAFYGGNRNRAEQVVTTIVDRLRTNFLRGD